MSVPLSAEPVWEPQNFEQEYDGEVTMREALVALEEHADVRLAWRSGSARWPSVGGRRASAPHGGDAGHAAGNGGGVSPSSWRRPNGVRRLGARWPPRMVLRVASRGRPDVWAPEPRAGAGDGRGGRVPGHRRRCATRSSAGRAPRCGAGVPRDRRGQDGHDERRPPTFGSSASRREVAAAVWIGFDQPRPIGAIATGGRLSAPVWGRMMAAVAGKRAPKGAWPAPAGVVARRVDPATGLVLRDGCEPWDGPSYREFFLTGREPAAYCPGQEEAPLDGFWTLRSLQPDATRDQRLAELEKSEQEAVARAEAEAEVDQPTLEQEEAQQAQQEEAAVAALEQELARTRQTPAVAGVPEQDAGASAGPADLSGWWEMTDVVESTTYARYAGLRIVYRILLRQEGSGLRGEGQLWSENGRPVAPEQRRTLSLTGSLSGDEAVVQFTEYGTRGPTNGSFRWRIARGGSQLQGTFESSAASSSGSSTARRLP